MKNYLGAFYIFNWFIFQKNRCIVMPTLQKRKPRNRELEWISHCHIAIKQGHQYLNLAAGLYRLPLSVYYLTYNH